MRSDSWMTVLNSRPRRTHPHNWEGIFFSVLFWRCWVIFIIFYIIIDIFIVAKCSSFKYWHFYNVFPSFRLLQTDQNILQAFVDVSWFTILIFISFHFLLLLIRKTENVGLLFFKKENLSLKRGSRGAAHAAKSLRWSV